MMTKAFVSKAMALGAVLAGLAVIAPTAALAADLDDQRATTCAIGAATRCAMAAPGTMGWSGSFASGTFTGAGSPTGSCGAAALISATRSGSSLQLVYGIEAANATVPTTLGASTGGVLHTGQTAVDLATGTPAGTGAQTVTFSTGRTTSTKGQETDTLTLPSATDGFRIALAPSIDVTQTIAGVPMDAECSLGAFSLKV
jgi:hypothetical protein